MIGNQVYDLLVRLFPICRSLTGNGVRETLDIIKDVIPINIHEMASGTEIYDWTIPDEWNINDAFIEDEDGNRIVDMQKHNLYVMGYSEPINTWMSLSDLQGHLYSDYMRPDAIPYRTSYYKRSWGFCIEHNKRLALQDKKYHVVINSTFTKGSMTYADLIINGRSNKEILISTYICHPSMANNELSGPCLAVYLAKWLMAQDLEYTYRIVFIPETIGAMVYMHEHLMQSKDNVMAGINISCVGDPGKFSYIPTRYGNTLADKVALNILKNNGEFVQYSFLDRGSNEKIFCAPGFNLPVVNIMRSKFNTYPEYHTSLDNLDFVTAEALEESYSMYCKFFTALEKNKIYVPKFVGEPCLGKKNLYKQTDSNTLPFITQAIKDFLAYVDGTNDLIDISNIIGVDIEILYTVVDMLYSSELIGLKNE